MTETIINKHQAAIIRRLFQQDGLRFAQINTARIPSDQFSYHLRQLLKAKLIERLPDQTYRLTPNGKTSGIMLNPSKNGYIRQGFIAVLAVAVRRQSGGEYFLVQERDKVPYKGTIAASGDKIYHGETVHGAADRAFLSQTGLKGELELRSIWHLQDEFEGEVVQDKYFYVHFCDKFEGEASPTGITGTNAWMTKDEIIASGKGVQGVIDILDSLQESALSFHEASFTVTSY